jgi:arabinofuranosyltransferase
MPGLGQWSARREHAVVGFILVFFLALMVNRAWLGDDCFLGLKQVFNAAHGEGLTFNLNQRVQVFTHPTWTVLLLALTWFSKELFFTTLFAGIFFSMAALAILVDFVRTRPVEHPAQKNAMFLAVAALATSQSFMDYTTSGLENPFTFFGVGIVFGLALMPPDPVLARRVQMTFFLALALTFLNRFDLALLFFPILFHRVFFKLGLKNALVLAWPGFVVILGWFAFSVAYFGVPFPNTFYAKLLSGLPRLEILSRGVDYFQATFLFDPITGLLLGLGLFCGLSNRVGESRALGWGIVSYLLYLLWIGGDFMMGRHFSAPVFLSAFLICHRLSQVVSWRRGFGQGLGVGWAMLLVYFAATTWWQTTWPTMLVGGVADERGSFYEVYGLLSPDRRWPHPQKLTADPPERALLQCAGGGRAALSDAWVRWVDPCGLNDPFVARLPAMHSEGWRVGHLHRRLPHNYLNVRLGRGRLSDPGLHLLLSDVVSVESDPIFSRSRWQAIYRLNISKPYVIDRAHFTAPASLAQ